MPIPDGMLARAGLALVAVLAALSPAAGEASKCRTARCSGKPAARPKPKPARGKTSTGWHGGTYDGGPGDPIIAPLPG